MQEKLQRQRLTKCALVRVRKPLEDMRHHLF